MANLSSFITQTVNSPSREPNLISAPSQSSIWTATGLTLSTTSATAELPLAGFSQTAVKFGLTGSTTSAYVDFDVPSALLNTKLQLLWYARASVTTIGSITLSLQSYASAANRTSNTSPTTVTLQTSSVASAAQSFQTTFDAASQQFFRLTLNFPAASGQWYSLAQMVVGPGSIVQGAAISDWQSFTMTPSTGSFNGGSTNIGRWRRVGSSMEIEWRFQQGTSGTAGSGTYLFTVPSGLTINTAQTTLLSVAGNIGFGTIQDGSTTYDAVPRVFDSTRFQFDYYNTATTTQTWSSSTIPLSTSNIVTVSANVTIPISEWASNGTVNLGPGAQIEFAASTTTPGAGWDAAASATDTRYGPDGAPITGGLSANRTKRVRFQYPIQADDEVILEFKLPNGQWVPTNQIIGGYFGTSAVEFGARCVGVSGSTTDVDVTFFQFAAVGSSLTATTGALAWDPTRQTAWRLKKCKASSPVGFGLAGTDGSSGLYMAGRAPGQITGATIASGMIGERLAPNTETYSVSVTGAPSPTPVNLISMTLTPGVWMVQGFATIANSYTGFSYASLAISTSSASIADADTRESLMQTTSTPSGTAAIVITTSRYLNVGASQTIYLVGRCGATSGSVNWTDRGGRSIQAIRIA